MEEIIMAIWAVIHFSIMPVRAKSTIGSVIENVIRSLVFFGILAGCLWLYSFAHKKEHLFNGLYLFQFFALSVLLFVGRHFLSKRKRKLDFKAKKITVLDLKPQKINFKKLFQLMGYKDKAPIGVSLISNEPVFLDLKITSSAYDCFRSHGTGKNNSS